MKAQKLKELEHFKTFQMMTKITVRWYRWVTTWSPHVEPMGKLGFSVTLMTFMNSCSRISIKSKKSRELELLRSHFNECLKSSCSWVAIGWRCVPAAQNRHVNRHGTIYVIIYEIHETKSAAKTEKSRDPGSIYVIHYIKCTPNSVRITHPILNIRKHVVMRRIIKKESPEMDEY